MNLVQLLKQMVFPDINFMSPLELVVHILLGQVQFAEQKFVVFVHVQHQLALLHYVGVVAFHLLFLILHHLFFFHTVDL